WRAQLFAPLAFFPDEWRGNGASVEVSYVQWSTAFEGIRLRRAGIARLAAVLRPGSAGPDARPAQRDPDGPDCPGFECLCGVCPASPSNTAQSARNLAAGHSAGRQGYRDLRCQCAESNAVQGQRPTQHTKPRLRDPI